MSQFFAGRGKLCFWLQLEGWRLGLKISGQQESISRGTIWKAIASALTNSCVIAKCWEPSPYICINAGLGTVDDARHWVEYCNESRHTYWADQRRKNGREEPYKVKYWALGNEIDGPWQLGNKSADEYAKFALETAKAMRLVDRDIKLVASGSKQLRRRLDQLESYRAQRAAESGRLHRHPHVYKQPRQ